MKRLTAILSILLAAAIGAAAMGSFVSGQSWTDIHDNRINAHGGGITYFQGTYYWYGECKGPFTYRAPGVGWDCYRTDLRGVSCYSSQNLLDWKFEGIVLQPDTANILSDIHPTKVIERPKVIYNEQTRQFVMWMHIDNFNYSQAQVGVAVSNSPTGPFRFLRAFRPNGQESRDMTLFKDDDGKAYLLTSSEGNSTMHINELTADYLSLTGNYTRNFINLSREAPAMFKREGKYYIITSGCTGWDPNEADCAVADAPMGPYRSLGNPCRGKDADKTFYAQSTFVLQVPTQPSTYILMLDKWNKRDLISSSYIWLPIVWNGDQLAVIWQDNWKFSSPIQAGDLSQQLDAKQ